MDESAMCVSKGLSISDFGWWSQDETKHADSNDFWFCFYLALLLSSVHLAQV